jgi:trehalose/maltose transport system permease protein
MGADDFARPPRRETRTALAYLAPILVFVTVFVLVPVIGTFVDSLFRDVSYEPRTFVGLQNFVTLARDGDFWRAFAFTLAFTAVAVALEGILGLGFALLLHQRFPGRTVLRALVLLPWAIPTIVAAKIWKLVFEYDYGVLNSLLAATGLATEKVHWLGTANGAFGALLVAEVWKTTPFVVVVLLAGLQAIPGELDRQARVDGARMFRRFFRITLPLLRPVLVVALVFRTIDSLRIFDLVYVLTGGGPGGRTDTLSLLGYEHFTNDRFGLGSAVAVVAFVLAFGVTLVYLRVGRFRDSIVPADG